MIIVVISRLFTCQTVAWYEQRGSTWTYLVVITVDLGEVDADLTDFPLYVDLSDLPAGFYTNVKTDREDIRVATFDGLTEVPHEVVGIEKEQTVIVGAVSDTVLLCMSRV